jgi:hypothetical protein
MGKFYDQIDSVWNNEDNVIELLNALLSNRDRFLKNKEQITLIFDEHKHREIMIASKT